MSSSSSLEVTNGLSGIASELHKETGKAVKAKSKDGCRAQQRTELNNGRINYRIKPKY